MNAERRTTVVVSVLAALIAGAAIAVVASGVLGTSTESQASPAPVTRTSTDLEGAEAALDPGVTSPPGSNAVEETGGRFAVPSVNLDVPLGEVSEVDGQIAPPGFSSVYRVRNRGVDTTAADQGTMYLVTHSVRGGGYAPGNALIDTEDARAAVDVGAMIQVADRQYTVTDTLRVGKEDLPTTTDIWTDVPGRLVVITCLQNGRGTPSTDNTVIIAQLVE